jgi:hypothetical protein
MSLHGSVEVKASTPHLKFGIHAIVNRNVWFLLILSKLNSHGGFSQGVPMSQKEFMKISPFGFSYLAVKSSPPRLQSCAFYRR